MAKVNRTSNIQLARKQKGIKQADLAQRLGVTQGTISSWEQGITKPIGDRLLALAEVLGVTTDYLLGLTDYPYPSSNVAAPSPEEHSTPLTSVQDSAASPSIVIPDVLQDVRVAFHGGALDGLTQDEVDWLAKFAEFLKSNKDKKPEQNDDDEV